MLTFRHIEEVPADFGKTVLSAGNSVPIEQKATAFVPELLFELRKRFFLGVRYRGIKVDHFNAETRNDPAFAEFAKRLTISAPAEIDGLYPKLRPARVSFANAICRTPPGALPNVTSPGLARAAAIRSAIVR